MAGLRSTSPGLHFPNRVPLATQERSAEVATPSTPYEELSRSVMDFGELLGEASEHDYAVKVLDPDVDLSTPNGRLVAHVICSVAEWEREMIATRTKEALAVKRAQGVKLGRPSSIPHEVAERISLERRSGLSLEAIAGGLNADGVPTPRGGVRWRASSIQRIAARLESVS